MFSKIKYTVFSFFITCFGFTSFIGIAQVKLSANGIGNTYEEINAILAPSHNVIEAPDCAHPEFGRHIDEVYDNTLNTFVFRFIAHKTLDNDRCKKFDRQRIEIKTYSKSPDYLKAIKGETVEYKWKFRLPNNFKVSKNFTHLHQIKSVGSKSSSRPIITLTARKGTPDRLELRHAPIYDQSTLQSVDLNLLKGHWLEVTEIINYANKGSYFIEIRKLSSNYKLFTYKNESIDMWQDGAEFSRPKWGIYRSLKHKEDLKDEEVLFNDFSIIEIPVLSVIDLEENVKDKTLTVSSKKGIIDLKKSKAEFYDAIQLLDSYGNEIETKKRLARYKLNVSDLASGSYYINFIKAKHSVKVLKILKK